jgi:hypothetical protein
VLALQVLAAIAGRRGYGEEGLVMRTVALNDADRTRRTLSIQTDIGRLNGVWQGEQPIVAGERIDVELELERPRHWAELIDSKLMNQTTDVGDEFLRGTVAAVFEDGVVLIQVGEVAVQVEILDAVPGEGLLGKEVVLAGEDLEFYPTGV